jgi:hypothetical protein
MTSAAGEYHTSGIVGLTRPQPSHQPSCGHGEDDQWH